MEIDFLNRDDNLNNGFLRKHNSVVTKHVTCTFNLLYAVEGGNY